MGNMPACLRWLVLWIALDAAKGVTWIIVPCPLSLVAPKRLSPNLTWTTKEDGGRTNFQTATLFQNFKGVLACCFFGWSEVVGLSIGSGSSPLFCSSVSP